jgi:hypothetical protein
MVKQEWREKRVVVRLGSRVGQDEREIRCPAGENAGLRDDAGAKLQHCQALSLSN